MRFMLDLLLEFYMKKMIAPLKDAKKQGSTQNLRAKIVLNVIC